MGERPQSLARKAIASASALSALPLLLGLSAPAATAKPAAAAQPAAAAKPTLKAIPIPTYQIEAITRTGLDIKPMGGANMMRMMLGGAPAIGTTTNRTLELRLESPQVVANPTAEHRIPAGLGMGAALPLKTLTLEKGEPPTFKDGELVEGNGRLLLFRGCAESAGADQPEIVSLRGWTEEQRRQAKAAIQALGALPWTVDGSGTSGRWPTTDPSPTVPAQGSLVGSHGVVSTFAPEIRFQVDPSHDFLAPLTLTTAAAGGARRLSWQGVPTALGYQATATGAGQREGDVVMWTSSEAPRNDSWVPNDLRAADAARLVQRQVLLPPERTSCAISAQAMAAMRGAMVTVTAYGDTLKLGGPKGGPAWQLSLERRSSTTRPVGEGMEGLDGAGAPGSPSEQPKPRGFNPLRLF